MPLASAILGFEAGPDVADATGLTAVSSIVMLVNARDWKIGTLTITPTAGEVLPTAGAIQLEQHNDKDATGTWFPVPSWDAAAAAPVLSTATLSVTANAARNFMPTMQWVRVRISTAFVARPASPFLRIYLEEDATVAVGVLGGAGAQQAVGGADAEDAPATGAPLMAAAFVRTANLATLVAGDVMRHTGTTSAQLLVKEGHLPELDWAFAAATGGIITTTDVVAKAAAGAGLRNYVYSMQVKNANAVAGEFVIKDGATIVWRGHLAANMLDGHEIAFRPPLRGTANTAVNIACITTGQQVYANLQGGVGI